MAVFRALGVLRRHDGGRAVKFMTYDHVATPEIDVSFQDQVQWRPPQRIPLCTGNVRLASNMATWPPPAMTSRSSGASYSKRILPGRQMYRVPVERVPSSLICAKSHFARVIFMM